MVAGNWHSYRLTTRKVTWKGYVKIHSLLMQEKNQLEGLGEHSKHKFSRQMFKWRQWGHTYYRTKNRGLWDESSKHTFCISIRTFVYAGKSLDMAIRDCFPNVRKVMKRQEDHWDFLANSLVKNYWFPHLRDIFSQGNKTQTSRRHSLVLAQVTQVTSAHA